VPDPVTLRDVLVRQPGVERRFEKGGIRFEVYELPGLPALFHRVKGRVKDLPVNYGSADQECRRSGGSPYGRCRIDLVASRAVLMALPSILISFSLMRFHPGLDVEHGFPEELH
jgi:hypothetical protein